MAFDAWVASPPEWPGVSVPAAAARAGALGLINLSLLTSEVEARRIVQQLRSTANGRIGVFVSAELTTPERAALDQLSANASPTAEVIVLVGADEVALRAARERCIGLAARLGCVVTDEEGLHRAVRCGLDFVVAKGNEAGGEVGEETTFVLLQRLLGAGTLPVIAWGGVGWHSAAACVAAGAAGVLLDWQLALTRESTLPPKLKRAIERMDGTETVIVRGPGWQAVRAFSRPQFSAVEQLRTLAARLEDEQLDAALWPAAVRALASAHDPLERLWMIGQDGAFAADWASRGPTVGRALRKLREQVEHDLQAACKATVLAADSPLARSHGTRFPVVQGPMTRVSDVPEFALSVAEGGGLPILALALMREEPVQRLLEETRDLLGDRPWGVGILGFVEQDLRAEQVRVIERVAPPFAVIAGGRPDQARSLEERGIATYLHVPSAEMLREFLEEGARRFVFEGRECGGHVGPRSSFVLWEAAIHTLLSAPLDDEQAAAVHVLFAGGIHSATSGTMVAALAQSLVDRGMKVGVLVGTGYLFTHEIVASGAIVPGFQRVAIETKGTVLLETGPGHSTRCAETTFYRDFCNLQVSLRRAQRPSEEARAELEKLNLGRLRVGAKGIDRVGPGPAGLVKVSSKAQRERGMFMLGQVAALRHERCSVRELHEDICGGSTERLRALLPRASQRIEPADPTPAPLDIAIIGMSCMLPGCPNLEQYWENILRGADCIGEVPAERFDWERWREDDSVARNLVKSRWGGFLQNVVFDPLKYGIPPASLGSIEPMQLMALELVDRALRNAGYAEDNPHRRRTSVVFGIGGGLAELGSRYAFRALVPKYVESPDERFWKQLPEWTEDSFAGILLNVVAGRIADRFNLGGANMTVDAACASSLAALYVGCRELTCGTADLVIAGGCDALQNELGYLCFGSAGALSPRGRSRAFDESADGIAISEGLTSVVLKRRADAERDGDRIYAVLRAVAGSSDGRTKGLTAPGAEGQRLALDRAYRQAGVSPSSVGLFEAHGTGTARGDVVEASTLNSLLASSGAEPCSIAIGSVKSNVGHTKCAAGLAGLIKAALALYHRVLPPSIHVTQPNRDALRADQPLYVNTELRPWLANGAPRRAGVSAFGFGGTNFHAVLEEYAADEEVHGYSSAANGWPAELFLFSAPTVEDLAQRVQAFRDELTREPKADEAGALLAWSRSLYRRFRPGPKSVQAAIVASSVADLEQKLLVLAKQMRKVPDAEGASSGVHFNSAPLAGAGEVAFVYPGQGSQAPNMLRDLAVQFPEVRAAFERADHVVGSGLGSAIFPPPSFTDQARRQSVDSLKATELAQPGLGACAVGLTRLLEAFGIRPDLAAGHSYGELSALFAAGAVEETDFYRLSRARGEAMAQAARGNIGGDAGAMLAVRTSLVAIASLLEGATDLWVANHNSPSQVVLSGSSTAIERVQQQLSERSVASKILPVACAFHSPLVEAARHSFGAHCAAVAWNSLRVPVYSNRLADRYPDRPETVAANLVEHLVSPVRFGEEIEAMYAAGARVFVEVGPGDVLSRLIGEILSGRPHLAVPLQPQGVHGVVALLEALGRLAVQGVPLDLDRLFENRRESFDLDPSSPNDRALRQPAHAWLVNGSRARSASAHEAPTAPRVQVAQSVVERGGANGHAPDPLPAGLEPPPASSRAADFAPSVQPAVIPPASNPAGLPELVEDRLLSPSADIQIMRAFHESMRQCVQAQAEIMRMYFGAGVAEERATPATIGHEAAAPFPRAFDGISAVDALVKVEPPIVVAPSPGITPLDVVAPSLPPAAPPAAAAPASVDLERLLVELISQKTGYPAEALSLDAKLEADLSIDSIKRVEIIGAFRRKLLPELREPPGWFMERMTVAATMRQVLDGVQELVASVAPAAVAAPAAPAAAAPACVDLERLLVELISQKTGYPAEALSLDAKLEADLSIDSIKRVEIIGAFRRKLLPELREPPGWFMERMTVAATMRQVLDGAQELVASLSPDRAFEPALQQAPPSKGAAAGAESPSPRSDSCPVFGVRAVDAPLGRRPSPWPAKVLVVTDDGWGIAAKLVRLLERRGAAAVTLRERDFVSRAAAAAALNEVRERHGPIGGLIHLSPLGAAPAFPEIDVDRWRARSDLELKGLLFLVQGLAPELATAGLRVLTASMGGGDFSEETHDESTHPWRGGLAGLLKSAALEWPKAVWRAVDFTELPDPALLLREFREPGSVEIGYRRGRRLTISAHEQAWSAETTIAPSLNERSVVLVTGGARGITAHVAREIARRSRATLVLLGRTAMPAGPESPETASIDDPTELRRALGKQRLAAGQPIDPQTLGAEAARLLAERSIRTTLAEICAAGGRAEYLVCDVRDWASLSAAVERIRARFGEIDALIHGAGVIEDKRILDKSADSFDRVVRVKVEPLLHLYRLLDPRRLKCCFLFASVAGFHGNIGQGDYAAANETLNRLARRLRALWSGKVFAVNWGPWAGGGMVGDDVAAQFAAKGIELIEVGAGCEVAWNALASPATPTRIVVGRGPWMPEQESTNDSAAPAAERVYGRRPLLADQFVERTRSGFLKAQVVLDDSAQEFLENHKIAGRAVLPFTFATELMAELVAAGEPSFQVAAVEKVQLLSKLSVEGRSEVTVEARAVERARDGQLWRVHCSSPRGKRYYSGEVRLERRPTSAPAPWPEFGQLPGLKPTRHVYADPLFHGPRFHVIQALYDVTELSLLARVHDTQPDEDWVVNPVIWDAAPQVAVLWAWNRFATLMLPTSLGRCALFADLGGGPVEMCLRMRSNADSEGLEMDVQAVRDGRVVGELSALRCTAVPRTKGRASVAAGLPGDGDRRSTVRANEESCAERDS